MGNEWFSHLQKNLIHLLPTTSLSQSYPESHEYFKERHSMALVQRGAKIGSNTKNSMQGMDTWPTRDLVQLRDYSALSAPFAHDILAYEAQTFD